MLLDSKDENRSPCILYNFKIILNCWLVTDSFPPIILIERKWVTSRKGNRGFSSFKMLFLYLVSEEGLIQKNKHNSEINFKQHQIQCFASAHTEKFCIILLTQLNECNYTGIISQKKKVVFQHLREGFLFKLKKKVKKKLYQSS